MAFFHHVLQQKFVPLQVKLDRKIKHQSEVRQIMTFLMSMVSTVSKSRKRFFFMFKRLSVKRKKVKKKRRCTRDKKKCVKTADIFTTGVK